MMHADRAESSTGEARQADGAGPSTAEAHLDLEHRTAYRFAMLAEGSMRCLSAMFIPKFGLTVAGWRVLALIGRFEPIFPNNVARLATMSADKVTRSVDRLVDAGLVIRCVDTEDRRRIALSLTKRGRTIHDEIDLARRAIERRFLSVLDPDELRRFYQTMDKLGAQGRTLFSGKTAWKEIAAAEGIPMPSPRGGKAKRKRNTQAQHPIDPH